MTSWLELVLAAHPEISLDDATDRANLVRHLEQAFPGELLADVLRASLGAVIRLAWLELDVHVANLDLIDKLADTAAKSVTAILLTLPAARRPLAKVTRTTRPDLVLQDDEP